MDPSAVQQIVEEDELDIVLEVSIDELDVAGVVVGGRLELVGWMLLVDMTLEEVPMTLEVVEMELDRVLLTLFVDEAVLVVDADGMILLLLLLVMGALELGETIGV